MTQMEIILNGYASSVIKREPANYTNYFCFRDGAKFAFEFARQQFELLMGEWYGSEDFQDEREEMTRLFEQRLGLEE